MTKNVPKTLKPAEGDAEKAVEKPRDKPRTVAEARLRNPDLAGQKMQQDGGVPRRAHVALDAKGSPFGNYDSVFISMVQQRWYALLENNQYMLDRRGQVALTFALHYDGRITALETTENTVGEVLGHALRESHPRSRSPFRNGPRRCARPCKRTCAKSASRSSTNEDAAQKPAP